MKWNDILSSWRKRIPTEESVKNILLVLENVFEEIKFKRGSKIKITDSRLKYYANLNPYDRRVAPDGSFKIPMVRGRKIKGKIYIPRILEMIDIINTFTREKK